MNSFSQRQEKAICNFYGWDALVIKRKKGIPCAVDARVDFSTHWVSESPKRLWEDYLKDSR